MASVRFTPSAEEDFFQIGAYTLRTWGEEQADRYLSALEDCCRRLAANPLLGRLCEEISPDLRRMEQGSHVIFYRQRSGGILISRVLHRSMLPERHTMDDELPSE